MRGGGRPPPYPPFPQAEPRNSPSSHPPFHSLVAALLLGSLLALLRRRAATAGCLLACAIHLKPYPVIYVPAFLASLDAVRSRALNTEEPNGGVPAPPPPPFYRRGTQPPIVSFGRIALLLSFD